MMKLTPGMQKALMYGALLGAGIFAIQLYRKGVTGVTADIVGGTLGAVKDVAAGAVIGTGAALGIPKTNPDQCAKDMARGDNWAASFSCDASTFLKWQAQGIGYNLDKLKDLL